MTGAEVIAAMTLLESGIKFLRRVASSTQLTEAEKVEIDLRHDRALAAWRDLREAALADLE